MTRAMTRTENETGRATSAIASTMTRRRSDRSRFSARRRRTFSATTIDASTTMPTEKASPPRLIRFDESPKAPITMNVRRNVIGSETTTTTAVRNSARKRKRTRTTRTAPWKRASVTVAMQASTSSVRS